MPEIGATLREARMRARIDISEIETATKIRAKYLRALENEEWDLLPGPTFVKTFLRTYAEALGLDAKLLVEDYKLRHERLSDSELRPISPRPSAQGGRTSRPSTGRGPRGPIRASSGGRSPRGPLTLAIVVAVIGLLVALGLSNDDEPTRIGGTTTPPEQNTTSVPSASTPSSSGTAPAGETPAEPATPRLATLTIIPTGDVNVCLKAKGQGTLINGPTLMAGETTRRFRGSRFTLTLGNNAARLRVNGKTLSVPASSEPIGYVITRNGRRTLSAADRPTCG